MTLLGGWVLVPLALALLCAGLGLLAERAAGVTVPGALVLPLGLAGLIGLAGVPTLWDPTAELAVPLVAGAAAAGLVLGRPWADSRLRGGWPWPLVAACAAYALFAAPSLLSGQGSIAGYVKLDDSAIWLTLTDHVLQRGRDLSGLAPSSTLATLQAWLGSDYPVGAFLPFGAGARIAGQDLANAYQPSVAFAAAILALGAYAAARPLVDRPWRAAAAAVVATQASLFLGYAQWGGVKEAVTAALLPPAALLAIRADGARALALVCLVAGALLGVLGPNGLAWGGPPLAVAAVLSMRRSPRSWRAAPAVLAVAGLPALATLGFVVHTTQGAIGNAQDLGNLAQPLNPLQGLGLWPAGDFRTGPAHRGAAAALVALGVGAAAAALAVTGGRRRPELVALTGLAAVGAVPALVVGSPWVDAKALAVLSPFVLLATAAAVALASEDGGGALRAAGAAGAALLVAGTAWSTALVLRDVHVAPRERLAELRTLRPLLAGAGPTLVLDFEIYAQRYFLAPADPEGATDLRIRTVPGRDGRPFPSLSTAEVDEIETSALWTYRTLVRRRTPVGSRPPAAYRRIWAQDGFEVWNRPPDAPRPLARMPLGTALAPAAVPQCAAVRALARTTGARTLVAVPRRPPVVARLAGAALPPPWRRPDGVRPVVDGSAAVALEVPTGGRWRLWVGGSVLGTLETRVEGRAAGRKHHELSHTGQWLRYGAVDLTPGRRVVQLDYERGGALSAGRGEPGAQAPLGPVALTPPEDEGELPVARVPVRRHRTLCDGRAYDWIEALP